MDTTPTTAAGEGGNFDPRQAAALLDQTTQQARRQVRAVPPWLWRSGRSRSCSCSAPLAIVRGQHPYRGPTAAVLPFVWGSWSSFWRPRSDSAMRATAGVNGKSAAPGRDRRPGGGLARVCPVVMGVLAGAGVSTPRSSTALYPPTVPLIFSGLAWAGIMAARGTGARAAPGSWSPRSALWARSRDRSDRGPLSAWACASCSSAAPPPHLGAPPQRGGQVRAMTGHDRRARPADSRAHPAEDRRDAGGTARWRHRCPSPACRTCSGSLPGNLIIQLRKLEEAGYLSSEKTSNGSAQKTTVALTRQRPQGTRGLHRGAAQPARRPVSRPAHHEHRRP